jgi:hypothetical protein
VDKTNGDKLLKEHPDVFPSPLLPLSLLAFSANSVSESVVAIWKKFRNRNFRYFSMYI